MILPLVLVLATAPAESLTVKVVSLDFSYPYLGEPGNTCQGKGSVYVRAVDQTGSPVVVRLANASGLSPGREAVLDDVRRAGAGRDGTAVFCAEGPRAPGAVAPAQPAPPPPPMVTAEVAPAPAVETKAAGADATGPRCVVRHFNVIKKNLGENKFGPSEFDPDSAAGEPEVVECGVARARNTNVLLVRMVKEGFSAPEEVVGAEWSPGSSWKREPDAPQRRAVKVYLEQR